MLRCLWPFLQSQNYSSSKEPEKDGKTMLHFRKESNTYHFSKFSLFFQEFTRSTEGMIWVYHTEKTMFHRDDNVELGVEMLAHEHVCTHIHTQRTCLMITSLGITLCKIIK